MSNESVFDGQVKEGTPDNVEPTPGASSDNVDVLIKRLEDKDKFIDQLKHETAQMREAVALLEPLKEELKALKAELSNGQPRDNTRPQLSEVDIKSLVQKTITESETSRSAAQNLKEANTKFAAQFGGDYARAGEAVKQRAQEMGLSVEFLKDVAARSPSAFLKFMNDGTPATSDETGSMPFKGTVNTAVLKENNSNALKVGTKAYYDDMMKKNPSQYFSPKTQLEIMDFAKRGVYFPS